MPTAEQVIATLEGTADAVSGHNINQTIPADVTPQEPVAAQENTPPPAENNNPEPKETPAPAAAQPAFNLDEELVRSTGGAVKSKDELVALAQRANQASEFETRAQQLERENAELKAKTEVDPFANEYTKKLNDLYRGGANEKQIQAFNMLNSVPDLNQLTPMQASSLALQLKTGITAEQANAYLSDKYNIDMTDPEARLSPADEVKLKIDSMIDMEYLNTQKAAASTPPANETEKQQLLQQQQNLQRLQQVEPMAKTVVNEVISGSFKGITINGKDGADAVKIDLPISDANAASLQDAVNNYVKNFDIQPNEAGKKAISDFAQNAAWIQNGKQWLIEAASQREKQVRAEYHNPSTGIQRGEDNPDKGKTKEQARIDNIRAAVLDY